MNKITKNQTKKLIIVLIIITLCNFVVPNYAFASELNGGIFFKPIAQFIARIGDLVIQALQSEFIGDPSIKSSHGSVENNGEKLFRLKYSPGIIFSGNVPGLDINFIKPIKYFNVKKNQIHLLGSDYSYELLVDSAVQKILEMKNYEVVFVVSEETKQIINDVGDYLLNLDFDASESISKEIKINDEKYIVDVWISDTTEKIVLCKDLSSYTNVVMEVELVDAKTTNFIYTQPDYVNLFKRKMEEYFAESKNEGADIANNLRQELLEKKDMVKNAAKNAKEENEDTPYANIVFPYTIGEDELYIYIDCCLCLIGFDEIPQYKMALLSSREEKIEVQSIAKTLRPIVATWYNVFKEFSLVGLLVVLVYVAIRMLLSTTSQDKAKYKKMLVDWFTAICIVFVLQYIISITLAVTSSISNFFSASVVGEFGEDILMSKIRNMIGDTPDSFLEVFAEIVMYVILVIFTVLFTIQYLKRTIYIAFLTLISPLVAFTYPLDKIKDGKAQAFSAWLKEFIYSALVQPVHLILYCMLVNSAMDVVKEVPIYAIIVIGFLLPAEKFVKEMFGLNKSSAVGGMATAVGGATIMNAMKKISFSSSKGGKEDSGQGAENNSKIRTANTEGNTYDGETTQNQEAEQNQETEQNKGTGRVKKALKGFCKGTGKISKKYVLNRKNGKKLLRGASRIAGASVLGTIGLAAGIATGDMGKAVTGAVGGLAAGNRVGAALVDGGANLISGASSGIRGIKDTYGEGKYGEEAYAKMKQKEEFRKSPEYSRLIKKYPGQEGQIEQFLNAGLTDARKMGTAMQNIKKGKYNAQEAIRFMKMADKCPAEILYDKEKFKTYLTSRDIPEADAEKIRKGIVDFK